MQKHVVKEVQEEHKGKIYTYDIGAKAENIETDDERQFISKQEKEKITGLETAFRDGCNVLVSTCTTYGATPESNSPAHIADAIGLIWQNRYNEGRTRGRQDVIDNPGAYGIDQVRDLYQHQLSVQGFEDVSHTETTMELWGEFDYSDTVQYQIPINTEKFLYAVTFDLEYYAIRGYESPCSVGYEYSLSTVEGTVIQTDSVSSGPTGSSTNHGTVTKNVFVDLLQKPFITSNPNLLLTIKYNMAGQVTSGSEQVCQASISFTDIQARYK